MLRGLVKCIDLKHIKFEKQLSQRILSKEIICRDMSFISNIKDKLNNKLQEKQQEKRAESFKSQLSWLVNSKTFHLGEFHEHLKKSSADVGASGWKSKIPGVSRQAEVQEIKRSIEILDKLKEEEKLNPSLLQRREKLRISEASGHPVEAVNKMLREYEMLSGLRVWLQRRVAEGLPLPQTIEESQELAREDPRGFPMTKPKQRRPRRRP